jgi:hypothetical protein
MRRPSPLRFGRIARWTLINLGLTAILLLALEGWASARAAHRRAAEQVAEARPIVAERLHTEYDALLGWINRPNIAISNFYGAGRHLTTNGQRVRNHAGRDSPVDPTLTRLVVSGDSFTFGYGVGDQDSWAARLDQEAPGLEVVNMGQGGYCLGQAYLWYRRDGQHLDHQLHLMAFITEDYNRMARDRFMGYGKPVLRAHDDRLVVDNVPPPRPRTPGPRWQTLGAALQNLHLAQALSARVARGSAPARAGDALSTQKTAILLFAELHRLHLEAGRAGALVHLPIERDYRDGASNGWRNWLRLESERNGWTFVDLVAEMRRLPAGEIAGLFIQSDHGRFRGSRGHYSEKGNAFIADALRRQLRQHPGWTPHLTAPHASSPGNSTP